MPQKITKGLLPLLNKFYTLTKPKVDGSSYGQKHTTNEEDEAFWEEILETFVNMTIMLIILHIGGVIASSIIDKEKLVNAMWTGKKEVDDSYH